MENFRLTKSKYALDKTSEHYCFDIGEDIEIESGNRVDMSGKYVRAEVAEELLALLKECDSLLVKHHESSLITYTGICPVCSKNNIEKYPDNIFGRIEKLIQSLK